MLEKKPEEQETASSPGWALPALGLSSSTLPEKPGDVLILP